MSNSLNLPEINQEQAFNLVKFFIQSNQNCFLFGRRGVGKMLDLETELPTPSGFVKLKDLKEGDQLFDETGQTCRILQLHPIDYSPKSYRITFDDGMTVNACADHLWTTWDKRSRKAHGGPNPTIFPQVRSTEEILSTLKTNTSKKETNHSIANTLPVQYPEQDLLVDPYVLGCWLGDGRSDSGSIECADEPILEAIREAGYSTNKTSNGHSTSKSSGYRIGDLIHVVHKKCGTRTGLLKKQLIELGLLDNKHIPEIYLRSSYEQRLALLQGLMDTDGCCDTRGRMEFCSVIPRLAHQTWQLANSLGIKASIHCNKSYLYGVRYKDRYRVSFITKLPVFKLVRKLSNIKKSAAQDTRNTHRYIVDVKPINSVPMRCITVDSPSHLYLITRAYIPTHNTDIAIQAALECGFKINYINLSVIERADLAGYPDISAKGDIINYKSPYFLPKLASNSKPDSIILFDEVDKVQPDVTAPLLEILQFKKINGNPINAAACILTGNLMQEGAYSNELSSALLDRGAKYILSFDFEHWIDWAKANNVHDLILGFLRSNPEFACGQIQETSYASPSPRSWTWASQALNKTKELKMTDIESVSQIIAGYVGSEAALRFKIWYEYYREFEPHVHSLIERGQLSLNFEDLTPTEKLVFVVAACYHAKLKVLGDRSKGRFSYLENLCQFFIQCKVDKEVQLMALYNSFDFDVISAHKLYACTTFYNHFTKLKEGVSIKK